MAADIFESYEVTIVSALILGLALVISRSVPFPEVDRLPPDYPRHRGHQLHPGYFLGAYLGKVPDKIPPSSRGRRGYVWLLRSSSVNTILWSFVVATLYAKDWRLAMLANDWGRFGRGFQPTDFLFHVRKPQEITRKRHRKIYQDRSGYNHPIRSFNRHGIQCVGR